MYQPVQKTDSLLQAVAEHSDTVASIHSSGGGEGFSFDHLLHHVHDSHEIEIPGGVVNLPHLHSFQIGGLTIDPSPTKHSFFLVLSALLLIILAVRTARQYRKTLIPRGLTSLMEIVVLFIRDEIVLPNMGEEGIRYTPYLLTTFFFILIMNVIGMIPYGATATGNIMVTAGLALIAFFIIQISALRSQGLKHYLLHLTGGVHWGLWIIMIPTEIIGLFTKPFALCVRLFANMNAGHIVILSLIGLIFLFQSYAIAPVSVLMALFINLLELLVAVLQAYIFTMLTSLFIGFGLQPSHEAEHDEHA